MTEALLVSLLYWAVPNPMPDSYEFRGEMHVSLDGIYAGCPCNSVRCAIEGIPEDDRAWRISVEPGTYIVREPIRISPGQRLIGAGVDETLLEFHP